MQMCLARFFFVSARASVKENAPAHTRLESGFSGKSFNATGRSAEVTTISAVQNPNAFG
jgi:hypothetical protein